MKVSGRLMGLTYHVQRDGSKGGDRKVWPLCQVQVVKFRGDDVTKPSCTWSRKERT